MNHKEAIEYIHNTRKLGSKLGLKRIRALLEVMGNPQKKVKIIHVAGTNGKGSVIAFIGNILMESGYKIGTFTSPSIHRYSERIRVNNIEITQADMTRIVKTIKEKTALMMPYDEGEPTEFEIITAMAFQYFHEQNCDFILLEAGLGGRLDATNVIDKPEVAVITTINYDHMDVLGHTLSEIAYEKAGIIKEKGDVVLYPQLPEVESVFEAICNKQKAKLTKIEFSRLQIKACGFLAQQFDYEAYQQLEISLLGDHQTKNAALAVTIANTLNNKGYKISEADIRNGLAKAKWPGRFEVINTSPVFLVDSAHNVEGTVVLAENLKKYFPNKKITFIVGILSDKDYRLMMEAVISIAERFITVTPDNSRALSAQDLEIFLKNYSVKTLVSGSTKQAIEMSLDLVSQDEIICAFGSFYYIGEVREYFGLS